MPPALIDGQFRRSITFRHWQLSDEQARVATYDPEKGWYEANLLYEDDEGVWHDNIQSLTATSFYQSQVWHQSIGSPSWVILHTEPFEGEAAAELARTMTLPRAALEVYGAVAAASDLGEVRAALPEGWELSFREQIWNGRVNHYATLLPPDLPPDHILRRSVGGSSLGFASGPTPADAVAAVGRWITGEFRATEELVLPAPGEEPAPGL